MQFKSILAVLALAVVVIATPIEPAAVNLNPATLVKRTTPQEVCSTTNQVASVCTAGGKTLTPSAALITIVLSILGILNDLQCLVANNNVNVAPGDTVLCCDKSSNSNTQTGNLIAINNQNSCGVAKVI